MALEEENNELKWSVRGYTQEKFDLKDERDHLEKKSVQLGKENGHLNSSFGCHNGKDANLLKRNQVIDQEKYCLKGAESRGRDGSIGRNA